MRGVQLGHDGAGSEVWLDEQLRTTHMHVIGSSGSGKSRFLEHILRQDIRHGDGLCLIDPTGNLYRDLVRWCETNRYLERRRILLFEPAYPEASFGFNPLLCDAESGEWGVNYLVGSLVATFAQVWGGEDPNRTPLLQRLLRAVLHVLVEHRLTLAEADRLTSAQDTSGVRRHLTGRLRDPGYRREWEDLNGMKPREFEERFMSVQNRLNKFVRSPAVRAVLGRTERVLDSRALMDTGGVLLCNLSTGGDRLPADDARLLGMLLVNDLVQKARGRPRGSRPFYLYIDECYQYLNEDIATILDQMRQFGLHLILAHQHLGQLDEAGDLIKGSIMTDAKTKVVFGGLTMESAHLMADDLFAGELDLEEPKHVLDKPTVVGHEIIWLETVSASESFGTSEGESDGVSLGEGENETRSAQWSSGDTWSATSDGSGHESHNWGGSFSRGGGRSTGRSRSVGTTHASTRTASATHGTTHGRGQSLSPIYRTLPGAVYSLPEQQYRAASKLRNLPKQTAIVKPPFSPSRFLRVPVVSDGYARDERVVRFRQRAFEKSGVMAPRAEVEAEIAARGRELERRAAEGEKRHAAEPDDFLE